MPRNLTSDPSAINVSKPSRYETEADRLETTLRSTRVVGARLTEDEQNEMLNIWQQQDNESGNKTLSRKFVEKYLANKSWYWPRKDDPGAPSLLKAWAFYEHFTLPRQIVGEGDTDHLRRMAERGESKQETELYNPFGGLPQKAMVEWGAGFDLYFISLWFFSIIMLVCGLINIFSIQYFASDAYKGTPDESNPNPNRWLQGSGICLNTEWVICTGCDPEDWLSRFNKAKDRFATITDGTNGTNFVLRNLCSFDEYKLGWPNYITLCFLMVAMLVFAKYLQARETRFDEDKVTASDYAVMVNNPPGDAKNPDDWREFFNKFANDGDQVTAVTVDLDNENLTAKLATRRIWVNALRLKLERGTDLDNDSAVLKAIERQNELMADQPVGCIGMLLCCIRPLMKPLGYMLNADELYTKITKITQEIKELQKKKYRATTVFVTFETEHGQRNALTCLSIGKLDRGMGRKGALGNTDHLFKGKYLLDCQEPPEPDAVRYDELSFGLISKTIRYMITTAITLGLIVAAGIAIYYTRLTYGPILSGNLTSVLNSSIPMIIKMFIGVEKHKSEGSYQRSVYVKLTLFRWTLSALLTSIITPFTHTLGNTPDDIVPTIAGYLVSVVWLDPILRLSDYTSNIKKHVFAPRATTQEEMNSWFNGSWFQLGERYTDFTTTMFVIFFYSALFPYGFFFGFVILLIQYYMDKFCLVRLWRPTPKIGSDLANFSRRIFFPLTLVFFAIISSFVWAQYPFDNLCNPTDIEEKTYTDVIDLNQTLVGEVTVSTEMISCNQNWRGWQGIKFPATPRVQYSSSWFGTKKEDATTWMSPSQTTFTRIYGWTSVFILFLFFISVFARGLYNFFLSLFVGTYKENGAVQNIDFSSNIEIFAYVPDIKRGGQPFPFLCCDIDDMDQDLIGWIDPTKDYDFHNLIFDVPHESLRRTEKHDWVSTPFSGFHRSRQSGKRKEIDYENSIYSLVKHYPTKWQMKLAEEYHITFD